MVLTALAEKTILSPLNCLGTSVKKSIDCKCEGLFLDSVLFH